MANVATTGRKKGKKAAAIAALPKHEQRSAKRLAERKEAREKRAREWSANRPKKDDFGIDLLRDLGSTVNKGSAWDQANTTGLSLTTIYNLRNKRTRSAMMTTLQMLARAAGGRLVFVKDN